MSEYNANIRQDECRGESSNNDDNVEYFFSSSQLCTCTKEDTCI